MSKATEQNDRLKRAITLSVILHIILIALLVWSSFEQNIDASGGGGGSDIDAVMVDAGALVEQYNRQQTKHSDSQSAAQQRQKQAAEAKAAEDAKQAAAKAQKQAAEDAKQAAAEAKKQAEAEAKRAAGEAAKIKALAESKAQAAADAKAAQEAKARAAAEAKEKAAAAAKADAAARAQAAADAKKRAATEAARESGDVGELLGDLAAGKNAPESGKAAGGGAAGQGQQKKSGASEAAISSYIGQVKGAIESRFYDADTFAGKTCNVRIKLGPDGLLLSASAAGGDEALCQAAINAARMAKMPKPPSQDVWQAVKDATLGFKP